MTQLNEEIENRTNELVKFGRSLHGESYENVKQLVGEIMNGDFDSLEKLLNMAYWQGYNDGKDD